MTTVPQREARQCNMYEGSAAELRDSWEGLRKLCNSVFSLTLGVGESKSISAGEKTARCHENV